MRKLPEPRAGEIWDIRFDPTVRPEQGGTRPAIVLSTDWFNEVENHLCYVAPITGTDNGIEYQIKIKGRPGGLSKNSVIMCEQARSMSVLRFLRKRGDVGEDVLSRVQHMVARMINVPPILNRRE